MSDRSFKPPPWRLKSRLKFFAVVAGIVVVCVGVVVGVNWYRDAQGTCGEGVGKRGSQQECVGVTDGEYIYRDDLADVQRKIRDENKEVVKQNKPYVSVAFLLPIPLHSTDTASMDGTRHQLQGAYLAQHRHNMQGGTPLIRLLQANYGSQATQWEWVVEELKRRVNSPDNLVAVAGIGQSLETSKQAIRRLAEANIPIIGSTITADDLSGIPGLMRVAPTNTDQVKAASAYIKPSARTALLIKDANRQDRYSQTLASAFPASFQDSDHRLVGQDELYDSSLPGVSNTFLQMMPNICVGRPDVIYFAGRGRHLADFLKQLAARQCFDLPITVLTGDDAAVIRSDPELQKALRSKVAVIHTALAHPNAWVKTPDKISYASASAFAADCPACFKGLFPRESLDNGAAIMAHDAALTAVTAIRLAAGAAGNRITSLEVMQVRNRLHTTMAIGGASGWISLGEDGNPRDKAVPILKLQPDGTVEFLELSSPSGSPPTAPS